MKYLGRSLAVLAALLLLVGAYTALVTVLASLLAPAQAQGSLVVRGGEVRASLLLGQDFKAPGLFHGRPSASGYDPMAGAGSNLGPTSSSLASALEERRRSLVEENSLPGRPAGPPPPDLLFASGSGLDPDISPEAARYQVPRIAAARAGRPDEASLLAMIARLAKPRPLGILGEPRVNVVELNLALLGPDPPGPQARPVGGGSQ